MRPVTVLLAVMCVWMCVSQTVMCGCFWDCDEIEFTDDRVVVRTHRTKFGQLCEGNPSNTRRTSDTWGQGHYGAGRGTRQHKGLDIVCQDGSVVYAPFDVTLEGSLLVYNKPEKAAIDSGINLRGENLCFKLFYVQPDRNSGTVRKGERLGVMLPMQSVYPGITSHIHVQMCDREIDPTQYFD